MKKRIKLILLVLVAVIIALSFCACGSGKDGKSAYEIWLENGGTGSEADFAEWLKGAAGKDGKNGESAYEIWLENGGEGSEADFAEWLKGTAGKDGESAYDIYIKNHPDYEGDETQWIEDLVNGNLIATYQVEYLAGEGGSISKNAEQTVKKGANALKVTVTCSSGYIFDKWSDGVETLGRQDKNITQNLTVTALFKQSPLFFVPNDGGYEVYLSTLSADTIEEIFIPAYYGGLPVTRIASGGFSHSSILRLIILPETVIEIGANAFLDCPNLQTIYMPNVQSIGQCAFTRCPKLQHIYFPSSLKTVRQSIFRGRVGDVFNYPLTVHIQGDEESTALWSEDWSAFRDNIEIRYNSYYTDYADLIFDPINNGKSYSARNADRPNLRELHLPPVYNDKLVIEVANNGFVNCHELKEVVLPASVKDIGNNAFLFCAKLETIHLAAVEHIESYVLGYCNMLNSVIIPLSVNYMGVNIFHCIENPNLEGVGIFPREEPITVYVEAKEEDTANWDENWSGRHDGIIIVYDYLNV